MMRLLYLTILYGVVAHEDALSYLPSRSLASEVCTKRRGELMVRGTRITVTGDYEYWKDMPGFHSIDHTRRLRTKMLNTTPKTFCGEIDGKVHELTAPKYLTRKIVKNSNFSTGGCEGKVKHTVEMIVDSPSDDSFDGCIGEACIDPLPKRCNKNACKRAKCKGRIKFTPNSYMGRCMGNSESAKDYCRCVGCHYKDIEC